MASLFLAANAIEYSAYYDDGDVPLIDDPAGYAWGHLQIINGLGASVEEIEVQFWAEDVSEVPDFVFPEQRNHFENTDFAEAGNPNTYKIVSLDVGDRNPDLVWTLLSRVHEQFVNATPAPNYFYTPGQNSNSYAATLLWMVGIDIVGDLDAVTPDLVGGFPGVDRNVLTDGCNRFGLSVAFNFDIQGTSDDDFLRTGDGEDTLSGLAGHDELLGGEAADTLVGGQWLRHRKTASWALGRYLNGFCRLPGSPSQARLAVWSQGLSQRSALA